MAHFLLYGALDLPVFELAYVSGHLGIRHVKPIPVSHLIPHFLLDIVLNIPQVVIFFHLQLDQICLLLCDSLAILKFELFDVCLFLALAMGFLAVEGEVCLLNSKSLLVDLKLASILQFLSLLTHLLKILLFELKLYAFLLCELSAGKFTLSFLKFNLGFKYRSLSLTFGKVGDSLDNIFNDQRRQRISINSRVE